MSLFILGQDAAKVIAHLNSGIKHKHTVTVRVVRGAIWTFSMRLPKVGVISGSGDTPTKAMDAFIADIDRLKKELSA